jgi:hypothetical protein
MVPRATGPAGALAPAHSFPTQAMSIARGAEIESDRLDAECRGSVG